MVFVWTHFSSFLAYVGRIRGYRRSSRKRMYNGHPDYSNKTHGWGKAFFWTNVQSP